MRLAIAIAPGLLVGGVLGALYFAGLWWTVRHLPATRNPALLLFASYTVRMALVALGIVLFAAGSWPRLAGCLVGFLIARLLTARFATLPDTSAPETRHES